MKFVSHTIKEVFIPVLLAVLVIATLVGFVLPQYKKLHTVLAAKDDVQTRLTNTDVNLQQANDLFTSSEKITDADKQKLAQAMPYGENLEQFLVHMHRLAQQAGLVITNMDVRPLAARVDDHVTSSLYQRSQLNMSLRGDYNSTYAFLSMLERYVRLVDVSTMSITNTSSSVTPVPGATSTLQVSLAATIYYLPAVPAQPFFPYGTALDTTYLSAPQFKSLQLINAGSPVKPGIDPFIPRS
jgi:Tfp pilus assembly protein PilO